jgi:hypothetical protein
MRLAGAEDGQLGGVLDKLLPMLLDKFNTSPPPAVLAQLGKVLSHISSRVKEQPRIPLPTEALLARLANAGPAALPLVWMFLNMALGRLGPEALGAACPALLRVSAYPRQHQPALLAAAVRALPHCVVPLDGAAAAAAAAAATEGDAAAFGFAAHPADRALVAEVLGDVLLYEGPPAAPKASIANPSSHTRAEVETVPPGMSRAAVCRLLGLPEASPTEAIITAGRKFAAAPEFVPVSDGIL